MIGVVGQHLFSPKSAGVFLRADEVEDRALVAAFRELQKRAAKPVGDAAEPPSVGEGVEKEIG